MFFFNGLLDLLFPPKCAFCRRILARDEKGACGPCLASLERTPSGGAQKGEFFSVCVSPLWYEGAVRESVLRYKFQDGAACAGLYGRLVADCIRTYLAGRYDLISWVPLSAKRLRTRGYDQARLLAETTARELRTEAEATLIKHRDTPQQSRAGRAENRRANVSGAYRAAGPERIAGKRILLIDDIITTGSTLSECARVLLTAGAKEVLCATLARARD